MTITKDFKMKENDGEKPPPCFNYIVAFSWRIYAKGIKT